MTMTFLDWQEAGRRRTEALQRFRSEDAIVSGLPPGPRGIARLRFEHDRIVGQWL